MTTRTVARLASDLPSRALTSPVKARASTTDTTVTGMRQAVGGSTMASSGSSAPMVNAAIDAQAACHGLG